MHNFIPVEIPDLYSKFLKSDMQANYPYLLKRESLYREDFKAELDSAIRLDEKDFSLEQMLMGLTWKKTRDRLASYYLHYHQERRFPSVIDESNIKSILELEKKINSFTVEGHSRDFLLLFYFELTGNLQTVQEALSSGLIDLLKLLNRKVIEIDIVIVLMMHALKFLGVSESIKLLKGKNYDELLNAFNEAERRRYHLNMINYLYSIDGRDILVTERV